MHLFINTYNSILLEWTKAYADVGISHYRIYKNNEIFKNISGDNNKVVIEGLSENFEHSFFVKAITNNSLVTNKTNTVTITITN